MFILIAKSYSAHTAVGVHLLISLILISVRERFAFLCLDTKGHRANDGLEPKKIQGDIADYAKNKYPS